MWDGFDTANNLPGDRVAHLVLRRQENEGQEDEEVKFCIFLSTIFLS